MTPDKIELLLMLSEDVKAQGDDLSAEMLAKGAAHARRVEELWQMLQRALGMIEMERAKFQKYLPSSPPTRAGSTDPIPRIVAKGPA